MIEKEMAEAILEAIELSLGPIRSELALLKTEVSSLHQGLEGLRTSFKEDFQNLEHSFQPATECKVDIDKKFLVLAKTLGPMIDIIKRTTHANVCDDDVKGLALLANESTEQWYQKDQFDDLLILLKKR